MTHLELINAGYVRVIGYPGKAMVQASAKKKAAELRAEGRRAQVKRFQRTEGDGVLRRTRYTYEVWATQ